MLVVYLTESNISGQGITTLEGVTFNKIAFGVQGYEGTTFEKAKDHFISYLRRNYKEVTAEPINIVEGDLS